MPPTPSPADLDRIRKLTRLCDESRESRWGCAVTRLTVLKGLCQDPDRAHRFVVYLARKTLKRVKAGKGRSGKARTAWQRAHRQLMTEALAEMDAWMRRPTDAQRHLLLELLGRIRDEQNEYKRIKWGAVRIIRDWDLLMFESALHCLLDQSQEAGGWAYQMVRDYAERSDSYHSGGLTPSSVPLLQDIVDFSRDTFGLDGAALDQAPRGGRKRQTLAPSRQSGATAMFTHRQGQFLAFIHLYQTLHRRAPAELDMVRYFRVTPPSVHGMVVKLEELGLITRQPGVARSIRVVVPKEQIPGLEDVAGPPW